MSSERVTSQDTLKLISEALAVRHGANYAERWLEGQVRETRSELPLLQRSSDLKTSQRPAAPPPEPLSGPLRLLPNPEAVAASISPEQARQEALGRFQAHAEARAAKLRERVGFDALELRSDKRARLEQFHNSLVQLALVVAVKRRYKGACTLTVHTVMEFVGYCLGVRSSSTLYSYLHLLKGLGLLDFKGHVTTVTLTGEDGVAREVRRCDGALLCVRLGGCKAAKLSRFDFALAEAPRDLQRDIERGHTVYRLIRQLEESLSPSQCRDRLKLLTSSARG